MHTLTALLIAAHCSLAQAAPADIITLPAHRPDLHIGLRHKAPAAASARLPVLFLHGASFPSGLAFDFPMDGLSWMDQLAAAGYDVYALDFPGYGLSGRYPETHGKRPLGTAREVVGDVDNAVERILQLTGKRQVLLIGHSWGGSVAALYAGSKPAKVGKLVMFAGITVRHDTDAPELVDRGWETLTPAQRVASMHALSPGEQLLHPEVFSRWGALWLQSDPGSTTAVRFPSGPSQDVEDLRHGKTYYTPAAIRAPTLLIRGEWDAYPSDADERSLLGELANAADKDYVVVKNGTHVMHLEAARLELHAAVLRFLEK